MAEIKLTENQRIAVTDKSGTLLVAAAAGSGKTAILTRRLIDRLCSPDCSEDISKYLVVTFTKAATGELRERLYKALSEYVRSNPNNARARRQLSLIGLAKISTIHSFCLDIIKSNFQALSLPSVLRMGEETETNVLLRTTFEELIAEKYESADTNTLFIKAVEVLSSAKSDEKFVEALLQLYKKLRGISEPQKKFLAFIDDYSEVTSANEIFQTKFGKLICSDLSFELGRAVCELECILADVQCNEGVCEVLSEALEKDIAAINSIKNVLISKGYDAVKSEADSFTAARAKSSKNCENLELLEKLKEQRSKCITKLKGVFSRYLSADADTVRIAASECHDLLLEIMSLLKELDKRFTEKKLEKGLLDYSDLEQYALKLLVADTGEFGGTFRRTELAESISKDFCEIYVDEYQDTNNVQDMIFRAISTYDTEKGTETNRFLVGDIKQSIYRFRGAQPEIFSSYIKTFEDVRTEKAKDCTTHKIYLSNNFRCSQSVIDTVNQVFDCIMEDYTADDRLIYSKNEDNKVTAPCELVLLYPEEETVSGEDTETLSEEALYIAHRIREMAYNRNVLRENGEMYRYCDFAILARSANSVSDEYRRAFRKMGVPFSSDTPEDFFALPEVLLAMCLLNCVDNPMRDIYTAGVMYSPLFAFTADELYEIRCVGRKLPFYSAVLKYIEENATSELSEKAKKFTDTIGKYRDLSRGTPTDVLIGIMFDETGLSDLYCGKDTAKRKNIEKIYELARGFEKTSFRGLSAFLDYLSDLSVGKTDSRPESEADSVRFMSIHRSKGLEFPIVFLSGAGKQFNASDEKEPIIFSASRGIGIKLRDTLDTKVCKTKRNFAAINTPFREAIKSHERADMLSEEKRLLYVAMTRARDRLIITSFTKDAERELAVADIKRRGGFAAYGKYATCYFDFLYHALSDSQFASLSKKRNENSDENPLICYCEAVSGKPDTARAEKSEEIGYTADQEKKMQILENLRAAKAAPAYKSRFSKIPAKLSVSQLKKGLLDEEENATMVPALKKLPDFMLENSIAGSAEKGTAAHIFMQFADYESLEKNGAAKEADRLLSLGFITKRMREIIELDMLDAFAKSELYRKIKQSTRQYRERRFNLRLPASEFSEKNQDISGDEFILIQGVSDLYFENPDGSITLVDFKTDRVKENGGENILKARHSTQLGYYKHAIQEITGKTVSEVYIYSFALGREILLDI